MENGQNNFNMKEEEIKGLKEIKNINQGKFLQFACFI